MANKTIIPQLRFPEFNGNWVVKEFGNLYDFKTTNSFSRDNLNYESGSVKNIHYGDIHTKFNSQFDITKELVPYVNEDIDISRISDENYLIEGDLVIADASEDYADIGKSIEIVNLNKEKTLAGLHTILARRKSDDIAIGFASFILKTNSLRLGVMKIAQGSKVLSISTGRLSKIVLTIPKPEEQTKITDFITKVDTQIHLLEKEKALLEKYKKGISQKIFNQEIRFKDDNGNDFPDWEEKKLGLIGNTINGLTGKTKEDFGEGKPYIQYMQIFRASKIYTNEFGFVKINEKETQTKVKYGDVFFTTSSETPNEIGISSVLLDEVEDAYLNSFCFGFRPNSLNELVPEFAQFLFRSKNVRKEIIKLAQGSTRFNMSKVEFMKQKISLPCETEQQKIASFLSAIDIQIDQLGTQIVRSKSFKKGLLQKMFV